MSKPPQPELALSAALDALSNATERSLMAQTGGVNACQLQKAGQITGDVKYDEGRLVVLSMARRQLRAINDAAALADYGARLAHELELWREALRVQQERPTPSLAWIAYRQGGIDALTEVLALAQNLTT
jgi:hypothetical protein